MTTPTDDAVFTSSDEPEIEMSGVDNLPEDLDPDYVEFLRQKRASSEVAAPAAPSTEVAPVTETGVEVWQHETLEFAGDVLEIRKPQQQALAAFSLASGKYVPVEVKNDITGLFISRHLSEESYGRVFSRLMDPDDPTYTVETIGELMRAIVQTSDSIADQPADEGK